MSSEPEDPQAAFIEACVWHGPLDRAEAILIAYPEIASRGIHTAALLGDDVCRSRKFQLCERIPVLVYCELFANPFGTVLWLAANRGSDHVWDLRDGQSAWGVGKQHQRL